MMKRPDLDRAVTHADAPAAAPPAAAAAAPPRRVQRKASGTPTPVVDDVAGAAWTFGDAVTAGVVHRHGDGAVAAGADALVQRAAAGHGEALPAALRTRFEASLGADLSGVRVHAGGDAATAADALGARAYAVGQDVFMGAGQYAPDTAGGAWLLAHEVAHTVQQAGAPTAPQTKLEVSAPGDAAEHAADRAADAMVTGAPATVGPAGAAVARQVGDGQGAAHAQDAAMLGRLQQLRDALRNSAELHRLQPAQLEVLAAEYRAIMQSGAVGRGGPAAEATASVVRAILEAELTQRPQAPAPSPTAPVPSVSQGDGRGIPVTREQLDRALSGGAVPNWQSRQNPVARQGPLGTLATTVSVLRGNDIQTAIGHGNQLASVDGVLEAMAGVASGARHPRPQPATGPRPAAVAPPRPDEPAPRAAATATVEEPGRDAIVPPPPTVELRRAEPHAPPVATAPAPPRAAATTQTTPADERPTDPTPRTPTTVPAPPPTIPDPIPGPSRTPSEVAAEQREIAQLQQRVDAGVVGLPPGTRVVSDRSHPGPGERRLGAVQDQLRMLEQAHGTPEGRAAVERHARTGTAITMDATEGSFAAPGRTNIDPNAHWTPHGQSVALVHEGDHVAHPQPGAQGMSRDQYLAVIARSEAEAQGRALEHHRQAATQRQTMPALDQACAQPYFRAYDQTYMAARAGASPRPEPEARAAAHRAGVDAIAAMILDVVTSGPEGQTYRQRHGAYWDRVHGQRVAPATGGTNTGTTPP